MIDSLLADARRRLQAAPLDAPTREAALLLGAVLGYPEAKILARGDEAVPAAAAARFEHLLARRLTGEPVAYLLGEREFYGRVFRVDDRVLIPRPETEHLVEAALERAADSRGRPRVLDVGTGSGCIAVTLALELPRASVMATDLSLGALALASANARALGARERVSFLASDLAGSLRDSFDLIVSNPPYVAPEDRDQLSPEITSFEPELALFAADGGTEILTRLARLASDLLVPDGWLLCEIGDGQVELLAPRLAAAAPALEWVEARRDYAGRERVVILKRRPDPLA